MAAKKEGISTEKEGQNAESNKTKTCFVIMPISDNDDYGPGHFRRVYEYIIQPACRKAGFEPLRADEVKGTQVIVIDILQRIINSEMAICDLSSRNPNVLYELGIRQAFDLPVTLIKDDVTPRIFDIQGFRDVFYNSNLRIDEVNKAVNELAEAIGETYNNKGKEVNSIVELLGISKASVKDPIDISPENTVLLDAIQQLRLDMLANRKTVVSGASQTEKSKYWEVDPIERIMTMRGEILSRGTNVEHAVYGKGIISQILSAEEIFVDFDNPEIGLRKILVDSIRKAQ